MSLRKAIVVVLGIGAVLGAAFAAKRMGRKMHAHMDEMAARCKEMMASPNGSFEKPGEHEVEESSRARETTAPAA